MENKKYIDKVLGYMVKGTKIDYDKDEIHTPFLSLSPPFISIYFSPYINFPPISFTKYCKNIYGLTHEEMDYVWEEYKNIIIDKIENGK